MPALRVLPTGEENKLFNTSTDEAGLPLKTSNIASFAPDATPSAARKRNVRAS
jgi:hypothetical protein